MLGSDNIDQELQRILPHHSLKNRPAQVRRIRSLEELRDAQILFVGSGVQRRTQVHHFAASPIARFWW